MALRLTSNGRKYVVNRLTNNVGSDTLAAELFQGNITPTQNDTDATYAAALANFTGYSPQGVGPWSLASTNGVIEQSTAASVTFQVLAPGTVGNQIYGYLIRDAVTGHVLWAERFAGAPLSMVSIGDNIVLIPLYSEQSQFA